MEIDYYDDPVALEAHGSREGLLSWRRAALEAYHEASRLVESWEEKVAELNGASPDDAVEYDDPGAPAGSDAQEFDDDDLGDEPWPPVLECDDADQWRELLNHLAGYILWDDLDYEAGQFFLDDDPDESAHLKEMLGITDDYYTDVPPDPTDRELEGVRRELRSICRRPEPEDDGLVDGLLDSHHDLFIGPCNPEELARETDCRFVEQVGLTRGDEFDCTYAEWVELFRKGTLSVAAQPSDVSREAIALSQEQTAAADLALERGEAMELEGGDRIESRDGGWVVVDRYGGYLANVDDSHWTLDEADPDVPVLTFPTPRDAWLAYLQSRAAAAARCERREAALSRLGRM